MYYNSWAVFSLALKPVEPNVIGLLEEQYDIPESRGTLRVCAELSHYNHDLIHGNLTIHDITATEGEGSYIQDMKSLSILI